MRMNNDKKNLEEKLALLEKSRNSHMDERERMDEMQGDGDLFLWIVVFLCFALATTGYMLDDIFYKSLFYVGFCEMSLLLMFHFILTREFKR